MSTVISADYYLAGASKRYKLLDLPGYCCVYGVLGGRFDCCDSERVPVHCLAVVDSVRYF